MLAFVIRQASPQNVMPTGYETAILKLKMHVLAQEQARGQLRRGTKSAGGSFLWEFPKCVTLAWTRQKELTLWQKNLVTSLAI
jgi:hypothetical protein